MKGLQSRSVQQPQTKPSRKERTAISSANIARLGPDAPLEKQRHDEALLGATHLRLDYQGNQRRSPLGRRAQPRAMRMPKAGPLVASALTRQLGWDAERMVFMV